jgi:hypothetical protein
VCETQGEGKQQGAASCVDEKFNHASLFSEQWRHAPLFRPDRVWSKAQNALNRVRPSKIKKIIFYFLIVFYSKN